MLFQKHEYSRLAQAESAEQVQDSPRLSKLSPWPRHVIHIITLCVVAVVSFSIGRLGKQNSAGFGTELAWKPELASLPLTWKKFDGNFNSTNKFKGAEPSNEIDWEWLRFSVNHLIDGTAAIVQATDEDIRRSWKDDGWMNTTVQLDEEYGGGYMATLEVFHQLHCLNMVRMGLRPERYSFALHYNVSDGTLSKHFDHCIDILRQVIMCNGDTSLLTFHWVKGNPFPYPDFNTWHQCRDAEQILHWALEHQPDMKALVEKKGTDIEMPLAP